VFSQFTQMLSLIARGLDERRLGYLMLTGSSKDRQDLVDRFEGGEADVFLISLKAGGVGLTLTRADTVIHYDPWWNPAAQDQATDRAYRIGQTERVVAYNLFVQGSVEERMLGLQQRKRRLAEGILDGGAGGLAWNMDDIEELFAPLTM
jgi:SNF2 family DNA or RNA helicase